MTDAADTPADAALQPADTALAAEAVPAGEATLPPARDAAGNALDEWGLPIAGPLRTLALAKLRRSDPATLPVDQWGLPTGAAGKPWRAAKLERLGRADPLTDAKDW